jgi:ABC-type bacteriocin/lantibiotic exporter with double-glycine peptidase domain
MDASPPADPQARKVARLRKVRWLSTAADGVLVVVVAAFLAPQAPTVALLVVGVMAVGAVVTWLFFGAMIKRAQAGLPLTGSSL